MEGSIALNVSVFIPFSAYRMKHHSLPVWTERLSSTQRTTKYLFVFVRTCFPDILHISMKEEINKRSSST